MVKIKGITVWMFIKGMECLVNNTLLLIINSHSTLTWTLAQTQTQILAWILALTQAWTLVQTLAQTLA